MNHADTAGYVIEVTQQQLINGVLGPVLETGIVEEQFETWQDAAEEVQRYLTWPGVTAARWLALVPESQFSPVDHDIHYGAIVTSDGIEVYTMECRECGVLSNHMTLGEASAAADHHVSRPL